MQNDSIQQKDKTFTLLIDPGGECGDFSTRLLPRLPVRHQILMYLVLVLLTMMLMMVLQTMLID